MLDKNFAEAAHCFCGLHYFAGGNSWKPEFPLNSLAFGFMLIIKSFNECRGDEYKLNTSLFCDEVSMIVDTDPF